jgi:hypothetical protein
MTIEQVVFRGLIWRGAADAGGSIDIGSGIYSTEFQVWLDEHEPGWLDEASAMGVLQPALEAWFMVKFGEFDPGALTVP